MCCTNLSGIEKSHSAYGKLSDLLATAPHTADCKLSELLATVPHTVDCKLSDCNLSELMATIMGADRTVQFSTDGMQHGDHVQDPEAERLLVLENHWADCQGICT